MSSHDQFFKIMALEIVKVLIFDSLWIFSTFLEN